ncbi:uncharacterized protein LOC133196602 [Saccostrea echinata]|uniref:uncharacterized protein LOC133196602 n=1 Tax=Saccostrea echinata TaxID=191078 RepID=UPI002A7F7A2B|nr:uncharacterized protein LOC133196602 [Saccostrea echinata]
MLKKVPHTLVFLQFVCLIRTQNEGVCESEPLRCCTDYKQVKNKCIACNGSYGVHCSRHCPGGFCGYKCLTRCDCDDCNSYNCTCPVDTSSSEILQHDVLPVLFAMLFTVFVVSLMILVFLLFKRYRGLISKEPETTLNKTKSVKKMVTEDMIAEENINYNTVRESQMILDPVVRTQLVIYECNRDQDNTYNVLHENN